MKKEERKALYETTLKRFIEMYYCRPEMFKPEYQEKAKKDNELLPQDFDECWNQLTDEEREDFSYNLCYEKTDDGKCKVYFHVFNLEEGYYEDLSLEKFRNTNKNTIEIYNCWGY